MQLHLHCFYRHEKLDMASKLYILEIIELRKNKWVLDGTLAEYYRQKLASLEVKIRVVGVYKVRLLDRNYQYVFFFRVNP